MSNEAILTKKQAIVAELKDQLTSAKGVVLTGYKGLTVAQDTELRAKLREAGVVYKVYKNTTGCQKEWTKAICFLYTTRPQL